MPKTNQAAEVIMERGPVPTWELPYDTITFESRMKYDLARFKITKVSNTPVWYQMGEHDETEVVAAYVEAFPEVLEMSPPEANRAFAGAGTNWRKAWTKVRRQLKKRYVSECAACGVSTHFSCDCTTPL